MGLRHVRLHIDVTYCFMFNSPVAQFEVTPFLVVALLPLHVKWRAIGVLYLLGVGVASFFAVWMRGTASNTDLVPNVSESLDAGLGMSSPGCPHLTACAGVKIIPGCAVPRDAWGDVAPAEPLRASAARAREWGIVVRQWQRSTMSCHQRLPT